MCHVQMSAQFGSHECGTIIHHHDTPSRRYLLVLPEKQQIDLCDKITGEDPNVEQVIYEFRTGRINI